jgi:hypothetical protein
VNVNNVVFEGKATFKNTQFVNNLILQTVPGSLVRIQTFLGTPDLSTFTLANNLYSSPPVNDWPTNEAGRLVGDPKLINPMLPVKGSIPDTNNYRITPGSPAINAGVALGQVSVDFFQQARTGALDIGADEITN